MLVAARIAPAASPAAERLALSSATHLVAELCKAKACVVLLALRNAEAAVALCQLVVLRLVVV